MPKGVSHSSSYKTHTANAMILAAPTFIIPFAIGLTVVTLAFIYKIYLWQNEISLSSKTLMLKNIISQKTITAIAEIIQESLFHLRIFKTNMLLGWMHMSFAFGWFSLIVIGKLQTFYCTKHWINPPWEAVFHRFFAPIEPQTIAGQAFSFFMDFFLLLTLSGLVLAIFKRLKKTVFGLLSSTKHSPFDQWALAIIWLIFPLRLLAESMSTAYYGGGSFLTGSIGYLLHPIVTQNAVIVAWWGYSFVLGAFLIVLPFSRYLHIPAEVVLILFRNWEIPKSELRRLEIDACSRCGICKTNCPLNSTQMNNQSVYFIRQMREEKISDEMVNNCLMCKGCENKCPVKINLYDHRLNCKSLFTPNLKRQTDLIFEKPKNQPIDVLIFPGCVGKLTPSITHSLEQILTTAGIKYKIIDESICCGRPIWLSGQKENAAQIIANTSAIIESYLPKTLLTSCPVCYNMFKTHYSFPFEVKHHTTYIKELLDFGIIKTNRTNLSFAYHDPCEIGRGMKIYNEPRDVIKKVGVLSHTYLEKESSLCCGGSLGNSSLNENQRGLIATKTIVELTKSNPNQLVTACPMCKLTLKKRAQIPVFDLSEIVAKHMCNEPTPLYNKIKNTTKSLSQINVCL